MLMKQDGNGFWYYPKDTTNNKAWIECMYSDDGSRFDIPLTPPKYEVTDVAYPYIDGGIDKFINDFKHSSENILLLLGKPGTGKSTFLKHLLAVLGENSIVTYDTKILEKDYFFGDFMMGNNGVLIMEDADMFLEARTSGNALMHKFLNVGDGLVSAPNKKIIFTTNLESSDNIDKALLRPGRCFAVVNFRPLTIDESKNFMSSYDKTFDSSTLTNSEYTLAELYNQVRNRKVLETKTKVGFY
jgi:SpoVK/Ycf46/Vps4 family AAA+-type ATPase